MAEAKQTITFAAEVADAIKAFDMLEDRFRKTGKALREGLGDQVKPANDAVDGLTKSLKEFKKDQVQQGRLVGFYSKEIGEFVQLSEGAKSALGGMGAAILEMASGAGPVALAMAGMELIKGAIGMIREESKRAAEEMKKFVEESAKAIEAGTRASIALASKERSRSITLGGGDADLSAARADAIKAAQDLQRFKARFGLTGLNRDSNISGIDLPADVIAKWSELEQRLKETREALKSYEATKPQNDAWEKGEFGPGNRKGLEQFTETMKTLADESKRAAENIAKVRLDDAQARGKIDAIMYDETGGDKRYHKSPAEIKADTDKDTRAVREKINRQSWTEEQVRLKGLVEEAKRGKSAFSEMGNAIAGAFSEVGAAIGGMAGSIISQIANIAALTVKFIGLAIAAAEASAAQTPVVGWIAAIGAGAAVAASVIGLIGGIPGRADGGFVSAGVPYLVGERGPELMVPGASGAIIPNHALGGGITLNFNGPTDRAWWRANQRNVVETLRDAVRSGRA